MSLNFYIVFFILSTSSWFTSALKCYKCEEKNPDADLINSFCSRLYNKHSWEIVECSGSCFSGSKPNPNVQGRRVGQRFVNPTYRSRALKSRKGFDDFCSSTQNSNSWQRIDCDGSCAEQIQLYHRFSRPSKILIFISIDD